MNADLAQSKRFILTLGLLTATAGEAIMHHRFETYGPYRGEIPHRINGAMIATESGSVTAYALDQRQVEMLEDTFSAAATLTIDIAGTDGEAVFEGREAASSIADYLGV